ncbi:MAG TPA: hypothetical protein VM328_03020 [Fimbriimonadaceae bacterium]|nr:hypothetical protein [Fimbriimonadaceae bacterium]
MINDLRHRVRQHGAPVCALLIGAWVVSFLAAWFTGGGFLPHLTFMTGDAGSEPWTFLSYPLVVPPDVNGFISLIFLGFWMWNIGGLVERELGSARFGIFVAVFTLACSISLLIGATLLSRFGFLYGGWFIASACTVVWGTRYPNQQAMFMLLLPIQARWLAIISVALVFFGTEPKELAPFAAFPLLAVHVYARGRFPGLSYGGGTTAASSPYKKDSAGDKRYFEEVRRREQERAERERLRKLFESSLSDEKDDDR